jgi:GNAT superfamily N-acetyltransferase
MDNLEIREVNREEIPASAKILMEAFNQAAADFGLPLETDVGRIQSRLEEDIQMDVKLLGAFLNGVQIGFAEVDAKDEEIFEVRQLSVLPEHQKQGCGQAMLDYAVALIRSLAGVAVVGAMIEGKQWMKDWLGQNGFWEEVSGQPEGFPCRISLLQKDLIPRPDGCSSCSDSGGCGSCGGCH